MSWGEGILAAVGVLQAAALFLAAWFAWRTYSAANEDRDVARLQPVVTEVREIAASIESFAASGEPRTMVELLAQQGRLKAALDVLPPDFLPQTRLLAKIGKEDIKKPDGQILAARREVGQVVEQIAPVSFGQLSGNAD